jgi:hypothetical protein
LDIVASLEEIVCALPQSYINLLEGLFQVLISDIRMVRGEAPMPSVILEFQCQFLLYNARVENVDFLTFGFSRKIGRG